MRFRGSFSPTTRSVTPTRDSSFNSRTAGQVRSEAMQQWEHIHLCDGGLRAHSQAVRFDTWQPDSETADQKSVRRSCCMSAMSMRVTCCQTTLSQMLPSFGQLSRGGPHSRSHHCLSHAGSESIKALERRQALNCSPIFNAIAQELTQDFDLLPGEELGRKGGYDSDKVRHGSGADLLVFIVDIHTQRLDKLDQGCLSSFEFCVISRRTGGSSCLWTYSPRLTPQSQQLPACYFRR